MSMSVPELLRSCVSCALGSRTGWIQHLGAHTEALSGEWTLPCGNRGQWLPSTHQREINSIHCTPKANDTIQFSFHLQK